MAVIDFQSTCVSSYRFVNLQQRTCDDEAQRIRDIAIYNESDGLPSRSTCWFSGYLVTSTH